MKFTASYLTTTLTKSVENLNHCMTYTSTHTHTQVNVMTYSVRLQCEDSWISQHRVVTQDVNIDLTRFIGARGSSLCGSIAHDPECRDNAAFRSVKTCFNGSRRIICYGLWRRVKITLFNIESGIQLNKNVSNCTTVRRLMHIRNKWT